MEYVIHKQGKSKLEDHVFDLIFLDVEMKEMNGFQTARKLKALDGELEIVIVTCYEKSIDQAFSIQAFRFLDKLTYQNEMDECIQAFWDEQKEKELLCIPSVNGDIEVYRADILWIEAMHNGSIIWKKKNEIKCSFNLKQWEEILNKSIFVRTHRKYIVNLKFIERIDEQVHLVDGCKLNISKKRRKELQCSYIEYAFSKIR